eukprot:TRINITY_DN136146_c0_g1_i1.p1 TRINITY_DN136146_c0_g1~~TRINITY_DN136146_c0_g1_i1.p1  ORF type:complete len:568 (+),score=45.01 TRINITY_DN136146_c0_g1_i1:68-1705(+)
MESLIGRRIESNGDRGTVRYYGPLQHDPEKLKTQEYWLGVEWDNPLRGKHNGTVNGFKYFECSTSVGTSGSLIKYEKANFGIPLPLAAKSKYKKYEEMTPEEKEAEDKLEQEMYVDTTKKSKKLTVTLVGKDKAYAKFADLAQLKEAALQAMNISSVDDGSAYLSKSFGSLEALYLDSNLLYDWEQYFHILWQLPKLHTISLTDNKFRKPSAEFIANLPREKLVHPSLRVVSLINMGLEWSDVDILLPSFEMLEELWLCRNKCSAISTSYKVRTEYLQSLNVLNLEDNGICLWEEIIAFGVLPQLKNLVLTSNKIQVVPKTEGFKELTYLSLEKNLVDNWSTIDSLNNFGKLNHLRFLDNPLENVQGKIVTRYQIIARIKTLECLNSSKIRPADRRDAELTYVKKAWEEYVKTGADASKCDQYMAEHYPRWAELVKQYGNPADFGGGNIKEVQFNIESRSVGVTLRSMCKASVHKEPVVKKLPETMTIGALKGLCAKIFAIDVLKQRLSYHADKESFPYDLEDDLRQLGYYAVNDGSEIWIHDKE